MTEIDGTDYCHHCKRVTGSRVSRGTGRTAFVCVECGCETDACFDNDDFDDEYDEEEDENICDGCGLYLEDCDCDDEE